jgi:hypothetical protein
MDIEFGFFINYNIFNFCSFEMLISTYTRVVCASVRPSRPSISSVYLVRPSRPSISSVHLVRLSHPSISSVRPSVTFDKVRVRLIRINVLLTLDRINLDLLCSRWLPHHCDIAAILDGRGLLRAHTAG